REDAARREAHGDGDRGRQWVALERREAHQRRCDQEDAIAQLAVRGAAIAVDRVAVVADLVGIQDGVAARLAAVGGTAIARAVVTIVADLAWIDAAVSACPRDADPAVRGGALGIDAVQPRRAHGAVATALRCLVQATGEQARRAQGHRDRSLPHQSTGTTSILVSPETNTTASSRLLAIRMMRFPEKRFALSGIVTVLSKLYRPPGTAGLLRSNTS